MPFVLHQPADEVEVGLAILDAVVPLLVRLGQLELEVRHRMIGEHLLEDLTDGHLLEDATVGRARHEPCPWRDGGREAKVAAEAAARRESRDESVEIPRRVVLELDPYGHVLAEDLVEVDRLRALAQQLQLEIARTAQLLARVQAVKQQDVRAKRSLDLHASRHGQLHWSRSRESPVRQRANRIPF